MQNNFTAKPFILTIFGASGDLAKLKLFPALYSLAVSNKLPDDYFIIGFARTEKERSAFQKEFRDSIYKKFEQVNKKKLEQLIEKIYYVSGQYSEKESYQKLLKQIRHLGKNLNFLKIFYLSVPPTVFKSIIQNLGEFDKAISEELELVIEKPFGGDVISATALYYFIVQYFKEDQIYLLDHYLGKPAVRSILHLRHHNRILNAMLKGVEVKNIQITAFEDIGIENRVGYFDQVGIMRDMIQSHLLQLLALVTMSIPISEEASAVHREKENILSAITFPMNSKDRIVLGQYESYRKLKDVHPKSLTDTFFALRLFIDRESWYKVPIFIRTGKKLYKKYTSILITLKKFDYQKKDEEPNQVLFELYPNERLSISLINHVGESGQHTIITPQDSISCSSGECLPEHAILLLEVMKKDRRYFLSFPEIIASWKIIDQISEYIKKHHLKPEIYKEGLEGPISQNKIISQHGAKWFNL